MAATVFHARVRRATRPLLVLPSMVWMYEPWLASTKPMWSTTPPSQLKITRSPGRALRVLTARERPADST